MKKLSYLLITILSFISISTVNADTLVSSNFYANFDKAISFYEYNYNIIEHMLSLYQNSYSNDYPHYIITYRDDEVSGDLLVLYFFGDNYDSTIWNNTSLYIDIQDSYSGYILYNSNTYSEYTSFQLSPDLFNYNIPSNTILLSNFDIVFNPSSISQEVDSYNNIQFTSFTSNLHNFTINSFEISEGDYFPTYLNLYNNSYQQNLLTHYQEINLNNYAYVALSLKDYTLRNDNINQFYTNIYTKGQLCLTPVYNYGMSEKSIVYGNDYQVDRCSVVYSDFTPVRTYILKSDLQNNAIYYLKAYDTSIENKVKINTNIFDITYITSENADSPTVTVNGRSYPTIAYNSLSSTATASEEEGYISGLVVNVFENLDENTFSNIFSNPLGLLKTSWGAIMSMLALVGAFIGLLPSTLQAFLFASFALALVLGIIKIIL